MSSLEKMISTIKHHWQLAILLCSCYVAAMNETQDFPLNGYSRNVDYFNFMCNFSMNIRPVNATFRINVYATAENSKTLHGFLCGVLLRQLVQSSSASWKRKYRVSWTP